MARPHTKTELSPMIVVTSPGNRSIYISFKTVPQCSIMYIENPLCKDKQRGQTKTDTKEPNSVDKGDQSEES